MNRSAPAWRATSSIAAGSAPGRPRPGSRPPCPVPGRDAGRPRPPGPATSRGRPRSGARPPATTNPSSGRVSPSSTRPRVVLPAPTTATSSPGWRSRSTRPAPPPPAGQAGTRPAGARPPEGERSRTPVGVLGVVHRRPKGVQDAFGGGQPVGAGVEQAGHRPNGGVELRDHQQHREGGPQPQAAGDQAHTKGDGHQRGRERGGQVQDHAGEERQAQRALVVRRYRSVTSRIPASWALPRLKARRLARPRITSRNQPDSPARASKFARARAPADRPMGP